MSSQVHKSKSLSTVNWGFRRNVTASQEMSLLIRMLSTTLQQSTTTQFSIQFSRSVSGEISLNVISPLRWIQMVECAVRGILQELVAVGFRVVRRSTAQGLTYKIFPLEEKKVKSLGVCLSPMRERFLSFVTIPKPRSGSSRTLRDASDSSTSSPIPREISTEKQRPASSGKPK